MSRITTRAILQTIATLLAALLLVSPALAQGDRKPGPPRDPDRHDGPPMRHRAGDGPPDRPLSDQEISERLDLLREIDPDLADRMGRWREKSPERVSDMLRSHWRLSHMIELKSRDPQLYELRIKDLRLNKEAIELADRVRKHRADNNADEAKKAEQELLAKVRAHFEVRQQVRQRELEALEKKLDEMRQRLVERQQAQDRLIEERVEVLLGRRSGPEW